METNKDLTNDYSQFPQLLVVKGLTGFEQIDFEIDARTNDANKKARDLADAWFVKKLETIPALPKPKEVVRMEFVPRVSQSNAVLTASDLPKAEDISKISFFASSVEMKWFTEKSLLETLPRLVSSYQVYRPKMLFQSGVITLKNGVVLGWRAENSQSIWLYTDSSERLFELPTRAAELPLVPRPKCSTYLSEYDAGKILGKLMELSNDQLTGESLKLVGDQVEGKKVETCHYRWKHSSSFQIEATFEFFPTAQAANEPLSGFKHLAGEQNSRRDPRIQEFQSIAGIGDEAWLITGDESIEICVQKGATLFSIRSRQVQLVSVDELKRVAKKVAKQF